MKWVWASIILQIIGGVGIYFMKYLSGPVQIVGYFWVLVLFAAIVCMVVGIISEAKSGKRSKTQVNK